MSSSSLRIFESCRTTVLASSYHYSAPKLTPLLGRHQQSVFGLHQLPDPSPSAATRRVHCSSLRRQCCATTAAGHYFHPSNVCPPRCEPASLGESERLARWRGTQGRDTHYTHTPHTYTRDTTSTTDTLFQHHPSTSAAIRPPASPIRCTTLNPADSHALTRLARVVRRRIPLHPSRVPADARTAHSDTPTLAFH